MAGKSLNLRVIRAHREAQVPPRLGLRIVAVFLALEALLLLALSLIFAPAARAESVKAELSVSTSGGFARFVFHFTEDTDAEINLSNGILVIAFKKPIDVSVDRIAVGAPDYVNAARRDPDGMAVRIALGRKVTANSMMAGDRLFVDLLPEGWVGLPPGLPQEVVDELARRVRAAEKLERQPRPPPEPPPLVRVRVGTQPTFTRYVFGLPQATAVTTDRAKERLVVLFDAPLRLDLADAQVALPPGVAAIAARPGAGKTAVEFDFINGPDVRTFREDNNFIVDVLTAEAPDVPADLATLANTPAPANTSPPGAAPRSAAPAPPTVAAEGPPMPDPAPAPKAEQPGQPAAAPPAGTVASNDADAPPPAIVQPPAPAAPVAGTPPRDPKAPVVVEVVRVGEGLRLTFPFAGATPAAVFRRADAVWLVFDAGAPIDVSKLVTQQIGAVRSATVTRTEGGQVVRIKVDRPRLTSLEADGPTWVVSIGDLVLEPTRPLSIARTAPAPQRTSAVIPFDTPQQLHRLADPEVGDTLLVVTALGPPRGFLRPQSFVEFHALASTHGVAIQPIADDIALELAEDKIIIARPGGLNLSGVGAGVPAEGGPGASRTGSAFFTLDAQLWGFDREADFVRRQTELVRGAAEAPEAERTARRLELARFYLARELYPEAKGVLDVVLVKDLPKEEAAPALVLRAIAGTLMGRAADALKDLTNPVVGDRFDAPLWRSLAYAALGKWPEARHGFMNVDAAIATLPIEMQRVVTRAALRAAIEMRDFAEAGNLLDGFGTLGTPADAASVFVLKGRMAEGLGRIADALAAYQSAAESPDRPAAAQGRLRALVLRNALGRISRADAISDLESLTTAWRGDATELEAEQLLGRLYAEEGRYRDALTALRAASAGHADTDMVRRAQDEAAALFDALFLGGKADALPPVEALSLFYDFRDLTPVGRRGDEMIRRLADRLVSVDLLDQASALLQHQVEHRLQGAARAQIATRLAVIYLLGRKPDLALQTLQASRTADLPNELRNQRLLLEARALSDTGRHDLALEVIANLEGREVDRLRADVLWAAKRWREAGEEIEKLYGERWREFAPLNETERADILRAALAYSLADDAIGLDRFRQKYAAKMGEGPDKNAFSVAIDRGAVDSAEFTEIAKKVSAADTLDSFLRDVRAHYPQTGPASAVPPPAAKRPS
ncbi:MAG TPA: tetratricopeptide repeat protein [Xanthobacteraceae bacterium]|nr:tetratricopeptide repeat protein [Xanthobacteraceae bacterium]